MSSAAQPRKEVAKSPETERECCPCGRFICEVKGSLIKVLCPKCKRMLVIETRGITRVGYE